MPKSYAIEFLSRRNAFYAFINCMELLLGEKSEVSSRLYSRQAQSGESFFAFNKERPFRRSHIKNGMEILNEPASGELFYIRHMLSCPAGSAEFFFGFFVYFQHAP